MQYGKSSLIGAALSGMVLLLPGSVHANGLRVSSYEMNDFGGTIQLESNATIGEPWIRLEAHAIKIWFPDIVDIARFDHLRDGKDAIRGVQLRPGAADSAVLRVDLGTGRPVSQDSIQVSRNGTTASVKVRLPAPPQAATGAPVTAAVTQPVLTPTAAKNAVAAPARAPAAAKVVQPAAAEVAAASPQPPQVEPAAKPLHLAAAKPVEPTEASAATPAATANAKKPDGDALKLATSPGGNLGILIAISVLLAGVYGGLKYYGKYLTKRRTALPPDIEVISSRRLGHRQELMVVRALGADHLLMCSNGKVERVTSVPSTKLPMPTLTPGATPEPSPAPAEAESQAGGLGVFSKLSSRSRLRRLLDAVDAEGAAQAEADELAVDAAEKVARPSGRPSFGPELLSAIHSHKLTNLSALPPLAPGAGRESESVAGIARLRGRGAN